MYKYLTFVVILVAVVAVKARDHRHHSSETRKGGQTCNSRHEEERLKITEKSSCGEPKEVFVDLPRITASIKMTPSAVWVKRCVGMCSSFLDYKCVALEVKSKAIPVRLYDARTMQDTCSWQYIEEHTKCGCCPANSDDCAAPRVFNPRKCSCQCPNVEERKSCLAQRIRNKKWNRSTCSCEERKR